MGDSRRAADNDLILRIETAVSETERVPVELIEEIDKELERRPTAKLWILRGDAIQLCDDDRYSLDDARTSYINAIKQDPLAADGYESLGHFTFAADADARGALQYFQRAIQLGAGQSAREALRAAADDLAKDDEWE